MSVQPLFVSVLHTQLVRGTLVAMVAAFIVYMTSQPAIASTESSQFIATAVAKLLLLAPGSDTLLEALGLPLTVSELAPALDHVIRKTAHFTEYAALGFVLAAWLQHTRLFHARAYWLAAIAGVIFAVSDEWHQTFVPGRSGELSDVLLDSLGSLVGVLLCFERFCNG